MSSSFPEAPELSADEGEVLVQVENLGKIFCRDLKKSLFYGLKDSAADLLPSSRKSRVSRADRALRPGEFWANQGIGFELRRGECLGIIGHNGAGKTTLLKMLNGLIKPDVGRVEMRGRVGALIALGAGFNPILTGRENVYVNGSIFGMTKAEIDRRIEEIIDFAELQEFIDAPVQTYSSGMQVRLGFSVAVNLMQPDILILDEVLAVGDAAFRAKCEMKVGEAMRTSAVIFVSHTATHIKRLCNRVLWLDHGRMKAVGDTAVYLPQYESEALNHKGAANLTRTPGILDAKIKRFVGPARHGEPLELEVEVDCEAGRDIGYVVVGITEDSSTVIAQSNVAQPLKLEGRSTIRVKTHPLYLRDGHYSLNFAVYGASYKDLVLRYNACANFTMKSGVEGWSHYHFEADVAVA